MKFGQYELFERIATGGMAEVYRGRARGEEGFEKIVAIKRILPHHAEDDRFVSMLVTEARIHSSLSHKNIVQIHDLGESDEGEYFIVLEYVDGHDLGALLDALRQKTGPGGNPLRLADAVALHILVELGEGVHFAHELRGEDGKPVGLVHRDISPANVLVSYAGEVKLSDFGLAKRDDDHSVVGSIKGSLAYMAPEQARRAKLDRRADIFSLGAILFEMLAGRRLRELGGDDIVAWQQVASGMVPPIAAYRPDLHPAIVALLKTALAPDPKDRFPDARALVEAARAALRAVHASDVPEQRILQDLVKSLLPPGRPRPPQEPSKVVRLVSEFLPRDAGRLGARATGSGPPGARPAPPGMTPPVPAPAPRPRTPVESQARPRTPLEQPRVPSSPPPPPPEARARPRTGEVRALDGASPSQANGRPPSVPPPPPRATPLQLQTQATTRPPTPLGMAIPRPATPLGMAIPRPATPLDARALPDVPPIPAHAPASDARSTGVADRRSGGRAVRRGAVIAGTFALAASAIHFMVTPLPVLLVWSEPARLEITSYPNGAEVFVDGQRLSAPTPTATLVARDRRPHEVELRKAGFRTARRLIRYDRARNLSVLVTLAPEVKPALEPIAPLPETAAALDRPALPPGTAADPSAAPR